MAQIVGDDWSQGQLYHTHINHSASLLHNALLLQHHANHFARVISSAVVMLALPSVPAGASQNMTPPSTNIAKYPDLPKK